MTLNGRNVVNLAQIMKFSGAQHKNLNEDRHVMECKMSAYGVNFKKYDVHADMYRVVNKATK